MGDTEIENIRKGINDENGDVQAFEDLSRVLNGLPAESPRFAPGSPIAVSLRLGRSLQGAYEASLMTMSVVPNLFEVLAVASNTLAVGTAGNALTAYNTRLDSPVKSRATVWGALDSGGNTTPYTGNHFEFFRDGYPTDAAAAGGPATTYRWSVKTSATFPIIVDGGSITVFSGGAAHTGFCTILWAELPESFIK